MQKGDVLAVLGVLEGLDCLLVLLVSACQLEIFESVLGLRHHGDVEAEQAEVLILDAVDRYEGLAS